jgi:hypothetical protein
MMTTLTLRAGVAAVKPDAIRPQGPADDDANVRGDLETKQRLKGLLEVDYRTPSVFAGNAGDERRPDVAIRFPRAVFPVGMTR